MNKADKKYVDDKIQQTDNVIDILNNRQCEKNAKYEESFGYINSESINETTHRVTNDAKLDNKIDKLKADCNETLNIVIGWNLFMSTAIVGLAIAILFLLTHK